MRVVTPSVHVSFRDWVAPTGSDSFSLELTDSSGNILSHNVVRATIAAGTSTPVGLTLAAATASVVVVPGAAAVIDGTGSPSENHFHRADVIPVASACRALLRRTGASVRQRRTGIDRVPESLRAIGVTLREYEVFELLASRLSNKALAARLHISPRTVEKHVAALLMKTSRDREALVEYAADLLSSEDSRV